MLCFRFTLLSSNLKYTVEQTSSLTSAGTYIIPLGVVSVNFVFYVKSKLEELFLITGKTPIGVREHLTKPYFNVQRNLIIFFAILGGSVFFLSL